jgi:hypothetical protein
MAFMTFQLKIGPLTCGLKFDTEPEEPSEPEAAEDRPYAVVNLGFITELADNVADSWPEEKL